MELGWDGVGLCLISKSMLEFLPLDGAMEVVDLRTSVRLDTVGGHNSATFFDLEHRPPAPPVSKVVGMVSRIHKATSQLWIWGEGGKQKQTNNTCMRLLLGSPFT